MSWELWWLFVAIDVAMSLTPGPAVLFVVSQGLGQGFRSSVAANLGILSGNLIWFLLSALGLVALVLAWPRAFEVLRWLGVAYLCVIGFRSITGHTSALRVNSERNSEPFARVWMRGIVLQLSNPKALVFFSALLPQFVRPDDPLSPIALQMTILAVTSVVLEFWILAGYGWLADGASHLATQPNVARWADRFAGAMLIIAALLTAGMSHG